MNKYIKILIILLFASVSSGTTKYIYPLDNTLFYKSTVEGAAVPAGTATGQMLYWSGTLGSWTPTETPVGGDRIPFWDNSASVVSWLTVGSGFDINDANLTIAETDPCFLAYLVLHPYNDANWNNAVSRLDVNQTAWDNAVSRLDANQTNWNTAYSSIYWGISSTTLSPVTANVAVQANGGFLSTGVTLGFTVPSGSDTRMMWIPSKYAFRAGLIGTAHVEWDSANIGNGSVSFGINCQASGVLSTCLAGDSGYANCYGLVTLGRFNAMSGGSMNSWIDTDPLLICGDGDTHTRHNSLVIYKNGNIITNGTIGINNSAETFVGTLDVGALTGNQTYTFPDITGTVALTTGVGGLSSYLPLAGGTMAGNIAMEANDITGSDVDLSLGTGDISTTGALGAGAITSSTLTNTYVPYSLNGTLTDTNLVYVAPNFTSVGYGQFNGGIGIGIAPTALIPLKIAKDNPTGAMTGESLIVSSTYESTTTAGTSVTGLSFTATAKPVLTADREYTTGFVMGSFSTALVQTNGYNITFPAIMGFRGGASNINTGTGDSTVTNMYIFKADTLTISGGIATNNYGFYDSGQFLDGTKTPNAYGFYGLSPRNLMSGNLRLGSTTAPDALLALAAGTATAGTAPLKFTTQANPLTVAEAGTLQYVGTTFIIAGTDNLSVAGTLGVTGLITATGGIASSSQISVPGTTGNLFKWNAASTAPATTLGVTAVNRYGGDTNYLGDPTIWVKINVNGVDYNMPAY